MAPTDGGFTYGQQQALALIPKFSSSLSMSSSSLILYEVWSDHRKGRGTNSVKRVLVGMSIVDILASFAWFLSTWAVPEDSGFAYASGTTASCNFQGFLLQIAIGAPLYNSSLALFYLLLIKQRWSDEQVWRIERWVHVFILTFTIGTSIMLLCLDQYNHVGAVCWVIGDPQECGNSSFQGSDVSCERGNWAWAYGVALFYGPLWICVLACVTSMGVLYREVSFTVRRASLYTTSYGASPALGRSGNNSQKVAVQAILYSLSFVITWMPSTLWSIAHWFQWSHYGLDIAAATAEPLQGFWNLLIFLRGRPQTVAKIKTFLSILFPCCCHPPSHDQTASMMGSAHRLDSSFSRFLGPDGEEMHPSQVAHMMKSAKRCIKVFAGNISSVFSKVEVDPDNHMEISSFGFTSNKECDGDSIEIRIEQQNDASSHREHQNGSGVVDCTDLVDFSMSTTSYPSETPATGSVHLTTDDSNTNKETKGPAIGEMGNDQERETAQAYQSCRIENPSDAISISSDKKVPSKGEDDTVGI